MGASRADACRAVAHGPTEKAKADFDVGVVRITANEYETALAVAAGYAGSD